MHIFFLILVNLEKKKYRAVPILYKKKGIITAVPYIFKIFILI